MKISWKKFLTLKPRQIKTKFHKTKALFLWNFLINLSILLKSLVLWICPWIVGDSKISHNGHLKSMFLCSGFWCMHVFIFCFCLLLIIYLVLWGWLGYVCSLFFKICFCWKATLTILALNIYIFGYVFITNHCWSCKSLWLFFSVFWYIFSKLPLDISINQVFATSGKLGVRLTKCLLLNDIIFHRRKKSRLGICYFLCPKISAVFSLRRWF